MNFIPFPILTTDRLILRKPTKADGNEVLFLRSDPSLNKYIDRPPTNNLKDAEAFIERLENGMQKGQNINWNITLKDNPKMIGNICLWNFSEDQKVGEVGYDLHTQFHGKGIMSEALKCVVKYGFQELGLEKIVAYTHRENESSKRLLENNNFTLVPDKADDYNEFNVIFETFPITKQV